MSIRFSECWQFDAEWPGTIEQQRVVINTFHLDYATERHRLMKRLDKSANEVYKRSYLVVGFPPDDYWPPNLIAVAGVTGINFRAGFSHFALAAQANHELFHVIDKHLLTPALRLQFMAIEKIDPNINTWNFNVQETWADAGREWWQGNRPDLTPILLPE